MNIFHARGLAFAIKTSAAAVIAILLALWFELPNPGWAGLTVFLTSQPLGGAVGAVVSRSVYRCVGTLLGVAGILFMVPALSAPTELMLLGIATWVGVFLYGSLLIRGPQSYVLLLAGYTLPLVGMSFVNNPTAVFDVTQWRVEEIGLGAALSICAHGVFAPRSVRPVLVDKVRTTLDGARRWMLRGLGPVAAGDADRRSRGQLGADLVEMCNLSVHVGFEAGVTRQDVAVVAALEQRLLALLPLVAGIEARLPALRAADAGLAERVDAQLEAVRRQMTDSSDRIEESRLSQSCRALVDTARRDLAAAELLAIGIMERLAELLDEWNGCLALVSRLEEGVQTKAQTLDAGPSPRSLHVDRAMAAHSAGAAMLAVAVAGALCWALGWDQGASAVGFAAMCSSMFAFLDDPRPMLGLSIVAIGLSTAAAALYVFAIFPAGDGAAWLALALAPLFFACALLMATPKLGLPAFFFTTMFITSISLQPAQKSDFMSFTAAALAMAIGATTALVVTSQIRVIGAETRVRRLVRAAWRELAAMADDRPGLSRAAWGSRMLDRIGLLLPRLAGTSGPLRTRAELALDDLRLGVNMLDLRSAGHAGGADLRATVERALEQIGAHFRRRLARPDSAPATAILAAIDDAIAGLIDAAPCAARAQGLTAATGLRLALFPATAVTVPLEGATA